MKSPILVTISWILLCAIAVIMPTAKIFVALAMGTLGLVLIANWSPKKTLSGSMIGLLILYATMAVGLLFSDDLAYAQRYLEIKLSFLVFPLVWWLGPNHEQKWIDRVLWCFVLAASGFALFCFGEAFVTYLANGDSSEFIYRKLSNFYHPTYQAAYGCFSIGILLNWLVKRHVKGRMIMIALAVLLTVYVSMLASKAGILCLAALLIFLAFHQARDKQRRKLVILHASLFGVLVLSVLSAPKSSGRIERVIADATGQNTTEIATSSGQIRLLAWRSALEVMVEKPFGVGTGDVKAALTQKYEEKGETFAKSKQLNAHNQFLQSGVEHGWWGMLLLIGVCIVALLEAMRMKNRLLTILILICGFNMLFESFLELQGGIVFFCFFLTLLSQSRTDAGESSQRSLHKP